MNVNTAAAHWYSASQIDSPTKKSAYSFFLSNRRFPSLYNPGQSNLQPNQNLGRFGVKKNGNSDEQTDYGDVSSGSVSPVLNISGSSFLGFAICSLECNIEI